MNNEKQYEVDTDKFILCSAQNSSGMNFIYLKDQNEIKLVLGNFLGKSMKIAPNGKVARIICEFESSGAFTFGPLEQISAPGFTVALLGPGIFEMTPRIDIWWLHKELITFTFPEVYINGVLGVTLVNFRIEGFDAKANGIYKAGMILQNKPGLNLTDAPFYAQIPTSNSIMLNRSGNVVARNLFKVNINPYPGEKINLNPSVGGSATFFISLCTGMLSPFSLLTSPTLAREIIVDIGDDQPLEIVTGNTDMPIWKCVYDNTKSKKNELLGDPDFPKISLKFTNLATSQAAGPAHVVIYHCNVPGVADGYHVLGLWLTNSSVQIVSFSADNTSFSDIVAPATVNLSWTVVNASAVTLSGVGTVPLTQTSLPVTIEESTTFLLTAFDSALNQIVSKSIPVTVTPSLASRLVPTGTILIWSGSVAAIPANWALCNGANGTPNLCDQFIVGAGQSYTPGQCGSADKHVHNIAELTASFTTKSAGSHSHGMPTNWYARSLSSGDHTGIDTDGTFSAGTKTQSAGTHTHKVTVTFPAFASNINQSPCLPPWYALCYIIKL